MGQPPPEEQDLRCLPEWYSLAPNKTTAVCPYGHKMEWFEVTVPNEITFSKGVAVIYGIVPYFFVAFLLLRWIIRRTHKETSWLLLVCFSPAITGALATVFAEPRPRSCLLSCGLPPDHSAFCITLFMVLMWDDVVQRNDLMPRRCFRATMYSVLLLPQPWSRVVLGDATQFQAAAGFTIGVVLAFLWTFIVGPCVHNYIKYWILGKVDKKTNEEWELELAQYGLSERPPLAAPQAFDEFGLPAPSDSEVTSTDDGDKWDVESPRPVRGLGDHPVLAPPVTAHPLSDLDKPLPKFVGGAGENDINPLTGVPYSKRHGEILEKRRKLPAWEARDYRSPEISPVQSPCETPMSVSPLGSPRGGGERNRPQHPLLAPGRSDEGTG